MIRRFRVFLLKRFADPEKDIGRVCVFLASDDAGYVTGETFELTLQAERGAGFWIETIMKRIQSEAGYVFRCFLRNCFRRSAALPGTCSYSAKCFPYLIEFFQPCLNLFLFFIQFQEAGNIGEDFLLSE